MKHNDSDIANANANANANKREYDEEYQREYRKMLSNYARMASEFPDRIDQLRDVIKINANFAMSNRPEVEEELRRLAQDLDAFLLACKTGEVEPKNFIIAEER